jgi:hypothetical protein
MARLLRVDRDLILNTLATGLGFEKEEVPGLGDAAKLSARDAFSYAVLSSSPYLDLAEPDNLFQLSRDRYRVFNQAERFDFQNGIFSLSDLRFLCTVNTEVARKPYIASGAKLILPIEYEQYSELQPKLAVVRRKLEKKGLNLNDFVITPIRRTADKPVELEGFFEYVVSAYFNRRYYVTDTQIPFYYGIGTPDIAAYRVPRILQALNRYGFLKIGGSIIEIMGASVFGFHSPQESNVQTEAVVFEAKTGQLAAPQIEKYTKTGIFNKAYEVIPCEKLPEKYAGLFTVESNGKLRIFESTKPIHCDLKKQSEYIDWLQTYLKFYMIANLRTQEMEKLVSGEGYSMNRAGILDFVRGTDIEALCKSTRTLIEGRQ